MNKTNLESGKDTKKPLVLVTKVSIPATLKAIPVGRTIRYSVRDMMLNSVRAQVCRMNRKAGKTEFVVKVYNNGEYFDITHY